MIAGLIALLILIGGLLALFFWYRPRTPIAVQPIQTGVPFSFHARTQGRVRLWLRYDLEYGPEEDGWAVDGTLDVRLGGRPAWADTITLRWQREPTSQPRRLAERGTFYGRDAWHGSESKGSTQATAFLGAVDTGSTEDEIRVTGKLHPAEGTTARSLSIFLSR